SASSAPTRCTRWPASDGSGRTRCARRVTASARRWSATRSTSPAAPLSPAWPRQTSTRRTRRDPPGAPAAGARGRARHGGRPPAPRAPAGGEPAREEALAALADTRDVDNRRLGAMALAETGVMADVPKLAAALRDDDALVRKLAERAMWEVWSRSGDASVDRPLRRRLRHIGRP